VPTAAPTPAPTPAEAWPIRILEWKADRLSPVSARGAVTFRATATGGVGRLYYQFVVIEGYDAATAIVAQPYSESSAYTWNPRKAGAYQIVVVVSDEARATAYAALNFVVADDMPLTVTGFVAAPTGIVRDGRDISLSAMAEGGVGEVEYEFVLMQDYRSDAAVVLRGFDASPTFAGAVVNPFDHYRAVQIGAIVRDEAGNEARSLIGRFFIVPAPAFAQASK
jgi:hypothetical protein